LFGTYQYQTFHIRLNSIQDAGKILTINPTKPARFIPLARNTFIIKKRGQKMPGNKNLLL
jgi:hypothetical protein